MTNVSLARHGVEVASPVAGRAGRFRTGPLAVADEDDQPGRAHSPTRLGVALSLALVCLLGVWLTVFGLFFSRVEEQRSQSLLYAQLREQLSQALAPLGGAIDPGTPLAVLAAPRAGLHGVVVVEGTSAQDLMRGPGHLAGTPLPGQPGVSVLFGRSVTYGAPFADLPSLRRGDAVTVTTGQGRFAYRVDRVRYPGDPLPDVLAVGGSRLTLMTSAGTGWRAGWAPQTAVYVDATLTGKPQPAPPTGGFGRSTAEAPMHGDTRSLVLLVLWLQGGLLALGGGVFAVRRWGALPAGVVGVPILVAVLWGASDAAMALLPNLL